MATTTRQASPKITTAVLSETARSRGIDAEDSGFGRTDEALERIARLLEANLRVNILIYRALNEAGNLAVDDLLSEAGAGDQDLDSTTQGASEAGVQ